METRMGSARRRDTQQFKSYYVVWKHIFNISYLHYNNKFKSYYVVWKLSFCPDAAFLMARLNRTMQYGNSLHPYTCREAVDTFKSYYVVWKPHNSHNFSYEKHRFKSYYVVWKLIFGFFLKTSCMRLNRTMQYGNRHLSTGIFLYHLV